MKANCEIPNYTKETNLHSDIVRILLLLGGDFYLQQINEVFKALGIYVSEVPQAIDTLMSQDILHSINTGWAFYKTSSPMHVNPALVPDILANIEPDSVMRYFKLGADARARLNSSNWYLDTDAATPQQICDLYTAICRYLHGLKVSMEWICEEVPMLINADTMCRKHRHLRTLIGGLLASDRMVGFFKLLTPDVKTGLGEMLLPNYENLTQIDKSGRLSFLFHDDDGVTHDTIKGLSYILHNRLLPYGHIDDIISRHSQDDMMMPYLLALKDLHNGNPEPMINVCQTTYEPYLDYICRVPVFVMYLVAAIMVSTNPVTRKWAEKLCKARELKKGTPLMHALLHYHLKGNIDNKAVTELEKSIFSPASNVVYALFAFHFQMYADRNKEPQFIKVAEDSVSKCGSTYLRMIFAQESELMAGEYDTLQQITTMTPFLPRVEKKARWELEIDNLIELTQRDNDNEKKKASAPTDSRVAYLVNNYGVRPILQKVTGTTWTKGRNIALKNFIRCNVEGMTEADRRVASMVEIHTYYGSPDYSLQGNNVIRALVGHPLVFTDDDNRLKIDITEEPLQLAVTTDGRGAFHLKTNIEANHVADGCYVDSNNKTSLRVVPVSATQEELVKRLSALGNLPSRAKDKLTMLLENLSTDMTIMSPLLGTVATNVEPSALIVVQLVPEDESMHVALFAKPLVDQPPYLSPGKGMEYVGGRRDDKPIQTQRDLKAEWKNAEAVRRILEAYPDSCTGNDQWTLNIEQTLELLDALNGHKAQACVEWPEGVKMRISRRTLTPGDIHLSVHKMKDWFAVEGTLDIDNRTLFNMTCLLNMLRESEGRFIRLEGDEYVALSEQLAKMLKDIDRMRRGTDNDVRLSPFAVSALEELEEAGAKVKADNAYHELLTRIDESDKVDVSIPLGIQAELREYQKEGYGWMARLAHWGAGACLADDMGLGKTLQSITLLCARRAQGPSLVVAPTSVLLNWQEEIARFAPSLRTILLNSFTTEGRARFEAEASDIVITSYGVLVTEQELLASRQWNVVVLDEAHTIKNRNTKMSKAAMTLKADFRIALTGTPLQNRLAEIWNLFQFLNPGLLGTYQHFTDTFILPIEKDHDRDRQRLLKRMLSPFILRRTKTDVLSELPGKTEIVVNVTLSDEERAVYENLRMGAEAAFASGEQNSMQALAEITRLRMAACNTRLVDKQLEIDSSKANSFMEIVANLCANHHRALVFSQFTSHLALIRDMLDKGHITYLYLDGSTPARGRAALVDEFQNGDVQLFLISLKAGGLGLNLTAADYVIHLDPWWNPAIEDQATDRSYRIGQQRPVTVYRLVATHTIEEKILSLHAHKKSLADALLEGSDLSARLTKEEILELLRQQ